MKLKKLLKTISPQQPFRLIVIDGCTTHACEVIRLDNAYNQPLVELVGKCNVISIRSAIDESQLPDYQNFIEIKIRRGGISNDNN